MVVFKLLRANKVELAAAFVGTILVALGFRLLFADYPLNVGESVVVLVLLFAATKGVAVLWRRWRAGMGKATGSDD